VTYYLHGAQFGDVKSTGDAGDVDNANAFRIGAEADGGRSIDAIIDEVLVYARALAAREIQDLAENHPPTAEDQLSLENNDKSLMTLRNVAITVPVTGSDPEGDVELMSRPVEIPSSPWFS